MFVFSEWNGSFPSLRHHRLEVAVSQKHTQQWQHTHIQIILNVYWMWHIISVQHNARKLCWTKTWNFIEKLGTLPSEHNKLRRIFVRSQRFSLSHNVYIITWVCMKQQQSTLNYVKTYYIDEVVHIYDASTWYCVENVLAKIDYKSGK